MANSRAEQLGQNRDNEVTVDAAPATTLKVVPPKFFFHLAEARFDAPVILPP